MPLGIKQKFLPISIFCMLCSTTLGLQTNAGVTNGADIYCFMRDGGNTHEPSWQAAYQFIKTKEQGLFKTSPKQAAARIVEQVVRDPIKYEKCGNYIGDLFTNESRPLQTEFSDNQLEDDITPSIENTEKSPKGKYTDPYNY